MKKKVILAIVAIFLFASCSNIFWIPLGLTLGTYEYEDYDSMYSLYINIQWNGDVEIIRNEFEGSELVSTIKNGEWEKTGSDTFTISADGLTYPCFIDSSTSFEMAGLMFHKELEGL